MQPRHAIAKVYITQPSKHLYVCIYPNHLSTNSVNKHTFKQLDMFPTHFVVLQIENNTTNKHTCWLDEGK